MDKPALLLTRPQDTAERFARALSGDALDGVQICFSPLLEIVPTGVSPDLTAYAGAIFTSAHGAMIAPKADDRQAFCVGIQTSKIAAAAGWDVVLVEQDAKRLVHEMRKRSIKGPLIHLSGAYRRGNIAENLSLTGVRVDVATLYRQELRPLSQRAQELLSLDVPVVVPLFSPRTAVQFMDQAQMVDRVLFVAISAAVAKAIGDFPAEQLFIADVPNGNEMARLVELLLCRDSLT